MSLRVEATYEPNFLPATCTICGRSTATRSPIRFILEDDEETIGDVCERCAYGSVDLWRLAMTEYAIRLETQAAVLRALSVHVDDALPAPEGIAQDLIRENIKQRPGPRSPFGPPRGGNKG